MFVLENVILLVHFLVQHGFTVFCSRFQCDSDKKCTKNTSIKYNCTAKNYKQVLSYFETIINIDLTENSLKLFCFGVGR